MDTRLIITKTPIRITFTGGGTDIQEYYKRHGPGACIASTIDKYIHVIVAKHFYHNMLRVSYSKTENNISNVEDIRHPVVRECLKLEKIKSGLQIVSITEVPGSGTGLGSSSSFTVGLLNALHAWKNQSAPPRKLAEEAVLIERERLKEAGGLQDQYIASFGGTQFMKFGKNGGVTLLPINMDPEFKTELQDHLLLLFTGKTRKSTPIHTDMAEHMSENLDSYNRMRDIAYETYKSLSEGRLDEIGEQLNENWDLKKSLSKTISNGAIDQMYLKALNSGATGGKLIGAGNGGFLMLFAPPEKHKKIIKELKMLIPMKFKFESGGSKRLYM
jgi:D-glycero-alpha-D-manno-heptose-7-phosphate kinase